MMTFSSLILSHAIRFDTPRAGVLVACGHSDRGDLPIYRRRNADVWAAGCAYMDENAFKVGVAMTIEGVGFDKVARVAVQYISTGDSSKSAMCWATTK